MNFNQIKTLNRLVELTKNLESRVDKLESISDSGYTKLFDELIERINRLENPPKRKPGRPRKVNAE